MHHSMRDKRSTLHVCDNLCLYCTLSCKRCAVDVMQLCTDGNACLATRVLRACATVRVTQMHTQILDTTCLLWQAELQALRDGHAEEVLRLRKETEARAGEEHARGKREGLAEKDLVEAQLKAQARALAEERELVSRHRLNAETLTTLSEQVRCLGFL